MSDYYERLIPKIVGEKPNKVNLKCIQKLLVKNGIVCDDVVIVETDEIRFIDCGGNLEKIVCNHCNSDISSYWGDLMSQSAETGFEDRNYKTQCCNKMNFLENIDYYFDVGFSRFVIELFNPSKQIDLKVIREIEDIIGLELKCIRVKY